jgi:endoglucanase
VEIGHKGADVAEARPRAGGIWFGVVAVALLLAAAAAVMLMVLPAERPDNPFEGRSLYVYPDSSAARAAAAESDTAAKTAFEQLASTPTAIWLLPEAHPTASVEGFVDRIMADAGSGGALPVFVVYGVPVRDCGQFSAGGLSAQEYPGWISAIAAGIAGRQVVVILEPDALALAPQCGTEIATSRLIRGAVQLLAHPATTIYLDGGHSNWLDVEQMAGLLSAAGVAEVRGFVTNVSNYNATAEEREYADRLSTLLDGAHYVIDTSRNGNGSTGEWCNPAGRAIGDTPSGVPGETAHDATLWVKNPGESDGTCNGGPPAGQWWREMALSLVRGGS